MKKNLFIIISVSLLFTTCKMLSFQSLKSTTYIKANDAFILGNNEHGRFWIRLKNISNSEITIWQSPITGGRHSPVKVNYNQVVKLKVERNIALRIENPSISEVAVELLVKGDVGLSMGYKN